MSWSPDPEPGSVYVYNDRLTLTPVLGLALSADSRTYSLLWLLAPYSSAGPGGTVTLEGER